VGRMKPGRKAEPPSSKGRLAWPGWTGFRGKTVWDWLQLLIVPLALAVVGLWFTDQQNARQEEIEAQRAQAAALQAYLDQMSSLMLKEDLLTASVPSEERTLARARTRSVLARLDPERKDDVVLFLMEASLIQLTIEDPTGGDSRSTPPGDPPTDPELRGNAADFMQAPPLGENLPEPLEGDPPVVSLADTELVGISLTSASLYGADLRYATLDDASLKRADLRYADLEGANLEGANLEGANLEGANLEGANLEGADISKDQLSKVASLEGATMPDGTKHP
jgi:hypothetical protein